MKNKVEQIKKKQERLTELLDLYIKVVENEGIQYHLFEDEIVNSQDNWTDTFKCECGKMGKRWLYHIPDLKYYLVDRETKEVVCYGGKQRLKSYMRIRQITISDVMNDVNDFGGW
jgi:hypothetical protein